jgi:DNA repair exonuclease SbcCD nuclease subunit
VFPFIVMAHLFAQGATISESEQEIQIVKTRQGVESSIFGEEPYYVALGHITDHKLWENHILDMSFSNCIEFQ